MINISVDVDEKGGHCRRTYTFVCENMNFLRKKNYFCPLNEKQVRK